MSMPPATVALVQAAVRVRNQNLALWDDLLDALDGYAAGVRDDMMRAPNDELQRAQGRAQEMQRLAVLLRNAPAQALKLVTKGN